MQFERLKREVNWDGMRRKSNLISQTCIYEQELTSLQRHRIAHNRARESKSDDDTQQNRIIKRAPQILNWKKVHRQRRRQKLHFQDVNHTHPPPLSLILSLALCFLYAVSEKKNLPPKKWNKTIFPPLLSPPRLHPLVQCFSVHTELRLDDYAAGWAGSIRERERFVEAFCCWLSGRLPSSSTFWLSVILLLFYVRERRWREEMKKEKFLRNRTHRISSDNFKWKM